MISGKCNPSVPDLTRGVYAPDLLRVVDELKSRFDHFLKTGDESKIPSDLRQIAFRIVSVPDCALHPGPRC